MTTKDAILKLATAVSGSTSANVATDVQALAVLAQAMTGGVPAEPLATVDDAIQYIADNYSGGGGGGGDFTTASVVFVNNATVDDYTVPCPNVYGGDLFCYIDSGDIDGETPFDVVLYGGKLDVILPMDVGIKVASVSGSIEINGSSISITGDGTVTYEDA